MRLVLLPLLALLTGIALGAAGLWVWQQRDAIPPPAGAPGVPAPYQGELRLFILVGQSNMSGRAPIPDDAETDPRIFTFGNDYRWRTATPPVDSAYRQVDPVSADGADDPAGYGPALPFATALLEISQQPIGLIPCARGSTAISQWQQNPDEDTLYGSCLKRIQAAAPMGELAGILIYQGENDAVDPALWPGVYLDPPTYADRFSRFVTDFRTDLEAPELPVIFAQIGQHRRPEAFIAWEEIQQQQATVDLPCTTMILTADLPLGDFVHLSVDGYRDAGRRFAAAYDDLMAAGCAPP